MINSGEFTTKGLAVYFYPDWNRDIIIVGVFHSKKDIEEGKDPLYYQVWDDDTRLDTNENIISKMPTREEIKQRYVEFF